jgi:transposase
MPRVLTVRPPTHREIRMLVGLGDDLPARARRRADAVLLYAGGWSATDIAEALQAHPNTIYADLQAFAQYGAGCLTRFAPGGAPARLTAAQRAAILRLAARPPSEVGLPEGRWSLATLRAYLLAHRVVRAISREHLRRVLQKGGTAFDALGASSSAPTRSAARS